ncbi:MAG TPA: hypothetical protein DD671_17070, partial [Balneolaceae bacterium]|nr:hypothetical protein [Balneolaceae bacterium]
MQEFEDPSQRLINNLEAIGADKALIVQLQAELDVKKATEQFYEIENELEGITIPVSYDVSSRLVTAQEAARSQV